MARQTASEQRLKQTDEERRKRVEEVECQNQELHKELMRLRATLSEIGVTSSDSRALVADQESLIAAAEQALDKCEHTVETGEGAAAELLTQLREQLEEIKINSQHEIELREQLYQQIQQLEEDSKGSVKLICHQDGASEEQDVFGFGTEIILEGVEHVINSVLKGEQIWIFTSSNDTMSGRTFRESVSFEAMHNLFLVAADKSSGYDIRFTMSIVELHDEYSVDLLAENVQSQVNFVEYIAVLNDKAVCNLKDVNKAIKAAKRVQSRTSSECFQHLLIFSTRTTSSATNETTTGKLCMVVSDPCTNILDYLPPASMTDLMSRTKLLARLNTKLKSLQETCLVEVSDDTLHEYTRRFLGSYCPDEVQRTYLDVTIMLDSVTWLAAAMAHAPLALLPRKCGRMRSVSQADSEASEEEAAQASQWRDQVSMKSM